MAAATGSSASHGVPKGWKTSLFIVCGKCEQQIVREYRVNKKGPNNGCIYTSLDHEGVLFCHIFQWFVAIFMIILIKVFDLVL